MTLDDKLKNIENQDQGLLKRAFSWAGEKLMPYALIIGFIGSSSLNCTPTIKNAYEWKKEDIITKKEKKQKTSVKKIYKINCDVKENMINIYVCENKKENVYSYVKITKSQKYNQYDIETSTGVFRTPSVNEKPTGKTKTEITKQGEWKIDKLEATNIIYKNKPAPNTKIECNSEFFKFKYDDSGKSFSFLTTKTNEKGIAQVLITETPENWSFTKDQLIDKIKNWYIAKNIKEPAKLILMPFIIKKIKDKEHQIRIKTIEQSIGNTIINNYGKILYIKGKQIKTDEIYDILKSFIDKEINSKIKPIEITVQEKNSHMELPDVKLEMILQAPAKKDLADDYFTGELLNWAVAQIKNYKTGKFSQYTDRQGKIRFNVYIPSKFRFETKHIKFHAFEKSTTFNKDNLTKILRLIDIGTKIRIEGKEKKGGELIEE